MADSVNQSTPSGKEMASWSASRYAKEFAKNPASVAVALRAFWDRLKSQISVSEFDVHWEFYCDSPNEPEYLLNDLRQILTAAAAAGLKNEVVSKVEEFLRPDLDPFVDVLQGLMSELRARTKNNFPELCDLVEFVANSDTPPKVEKNAARDAKICREFKKGIAQKDLAARYGLTTGRISQIIKKVI